MVNHGWWKLAQSMVNHGWWKAWPEHGQPWLTEVPFHKPWLTMVDKILVGAWSTMADWGAISETMVNHGQWNDSGMVKSTMVDHGQPWWPWSSVPWLTMVSHGAILQKHGSHGGTMASQPGQEQVPSDSWEYIGTRFRCWHEIALCNLECNDYSKANFKVCRPASKWVSV